MRRFRSDDLKIKSLYNSTNINNNHYMFDYFKNVDNEFSLIDLKEKSRKDLFKLKKKDNKRSNK